MTKTQMRCFLDRSSFKCALGTLAALSVYDASGYGIAYVLSVGVLIAASGLLAKRMNFGEVARRAPERLGLSLSIVAMIAVACLISGWSSHRATFVTGDELCSVRQSLAFEKLRVTLPRDFFGPHIDPTGTCFARSARGLFSVQAPGWPAVLAAGKWLGIPAERLPWVLATMTLFVAGSIGALIGSTPLALAIMVSLWHNQFFDAISRSFWSHTLAMLCVALTLLGVIAAHVALTARVRLLWLSFAGVATGLLLLTRPLEGLSVIASVLLSLAFRGPNERKEKIAIMVLAFGAGPLVGGILYGLFNHFTTGSFFVSGYQYQYGPGHNPGFFNVSPNGLAHTPERAWLLLHHHVRHVLLFVVPGGLYFLVAVIAGMGMAWTRPVGLALLMLICIWLGASTYWASSYFVGPRFYYESMIPLTVVVFGALWNVVRLAESRLALLRRYTWLGPLFYVAMAYLILPNPPLR